MHRRLSLGAVLLAAASLAGGLLAGAAPPVAAAAAPETISTVAGGPGRGTATNVFQEPQAVTASTGRVVYVADGYVVRRLDTNANWEGVTAGQGVPGFSGDGGPAVSAQLGGVSAVAVDHFGNVVVLDTDNNRVRVVAARSGRFYGQAMTAGDIYTVAGDGSFGYSGDGGPATAAGLSFPEGVAVDPAGNLVIADTDAYRVRVVAARSGRFYGQAMTAGDIYTVAGNGTSGYTGDGGPARGAELGFLQAVTVDGAGNLVLSDAVNGVIRVVAARSGTFYGQPMTAGDIYTVAGNGTSGFSGDGGPATKAELNFPDGVAIDPDGNLAIADSANNRVRVVAAQSGTFYGQAMTVGDIYTVAGDGSNGLSGDTGPATAAALSFPEGVTFDMAGNLVIADSANHRVRVVAAQSGTFYGQAMKGGHIYTAAGNAIPGSSGNRGPARNAVLYVPDSGPTESAVTADGKNLIVATERPGLVSSAGPRAASSARPLTAGHIYTDRRDRHRRFLRGRRARPVGPGLGAPRAGRRRGREPGHRGQQQQPGPGGGRPHRHVLRPADDRRGHLHGGRHRHQRLLRGRRPGDRGPAVHPGSRRGGPGREPGDRRHRQQPGPGGGRARPARSTARP